ncbi:MAG: patatin-like phospholipase family protein [Solirubrobacterales bacterium]|nr:patatin-like phospholipase family protein [Solirubrobacterales bacterium]
MRILSIDGGGIRGLIPAVVLAEIERRTDKRIAELFDLIAGTSTGGILACALTAPGPRGAGSPRYTAAELSGFYEEEGPHIFSRSLLKRIVSLEGLVDERYEDDGLNRALTTYLKDTRLRDAVTPILVAAYDLERRAAFFFRSGRAVSDAAHDFSMVDVARATSAAPTYFEPIEISDAAGARRYPLVDGGVFAINPAMCAYADVPDPTRIELIASLGTGKVTRPVDYRKARSWGQLEWARPLIDVVFDGVADTVDFQLSKLLPGGDYLRLQVELRRANDGLDDAGAQNLKRLRKEAERLIAERDDDIESLCERLLSPRPA